MISNLKREYPSVNILGYTCPPIEDVEELVNTFTESLDRSKARYSLGIIRFSKTRDVY